MRIAILAALLAVPVFSSCLAAAVGVGVGVVASQEMLDNNTYETRLNLDVKKVWPEVKTALSDASLGVIEVDENVRMAKAKIDGASVTVTVEAFDENKTVMRTNARKYGGMLSDGEMARLIQERILRRLEPK
jgi:uncharacterized protein DUF3568